jgi:hypothetical protein
MRIGRSINKDKATKGGIVMVRQHYIKICKRQNTDVTYTVNNNRIEITFEQAVHHGFHTLVVDINGDIISNNGLLCKICKDKCTIDSKEG